MLASAGAPSSAGLMSLRRRWSDAVTVRWCWSLGSRGRRCLHQHPTGAVVLVLMLVKRTSLSRCVAALPCWCCWLALLLGGSRRQRTCWGIDSCLKIFRCHRGRITVGYYDVRMYDHGRLIFACAAGASIVGGSGRWVSTMILVTGSITCYFVDQSVNVHL